ncbi:sensor domain-containing diguanylate cyclase [Neptuniibacter halophilus]|uniref:sensor domain-containing diguanylate cyclase n=1 Tax=Neptuniibacter halophilus TaxID=651666 RepID=UPI00257236DD|nr:sensor domain-containing diguanylate cyclase [Neptuniibacter halophilus]
MSRHSNPEKTLEYVLDIIADGVWDWNILSGHVDRSPGWYRMLGYDVDCFNKDVLTWESVIHPEDLPRVMEHFENYLQGREPLYRIQYRCVCLDGEPLWVEDSGRIVEWTEAGKPARMIGAHTNIHALKTTQKRLEQQNRILQGEYENLEHIVRERTAELAQLNQTLAEKVEEIEYIASRDALTGAYNRRMFEQLIDIEIKRAQRYSQPMCVILADIDLFKEINDRYGHKMGDKVLANVAGLLREHIRDSDVLARWGGEEFAIILPNTLSDMALEMAERLRKLIARQKTDGKVQVTCSFGVTQYHQLDSGDTLFARMDQALYQAKESDRNNVRLMMPGT